MTTTRKSIISILLFLLLTPIINFCLIQDLQAISPEKDIQWEAFVGETQYPTSSNPARIVGRLIKTFLGVLGILFVILIIYGGYKWLTAGGDEEDVKIAKAYIKNAVIGLAIILAAYAVTYYIFNVLIRATGYYTPEYQ